MREYGMSVTSDKSGTRTMIGPTMASTFSMILLPTHNSSFI